jgi:hypothetical protein
MIMNNDDNDNDNDNRINTPASKDNAQHTTPRNNSTDVMLEKVKRKRQYFTCLQYFLLAGIKCPPVMNCGESQFPIPFHST